MKKNVLITIYDMVITAIEQIKESENETKTLTAISFLSMIAGVCRGALDMDKKDENENIDNLH